VDASRPVLVLLFLPFASHSHNFRSFTHRHRMRGVAGKGPAAQGSLPTGGRRAVVAASGAGPHYERAREGR
jgi:hypothetical protein